MCVISVGVIHVHAYCLYCLTLGVGGTNLSMCGVISALTTGVGVASALSAGRCGGNQCSDNRCGGD